MTAEQENMLSEFDFIVAIDASGSMGETDMPGSKSRWSYMQESLTAFARDLATIDSNGIDIVVFSGTNIQTYQKTNADAVKNIFNSRSPRGSTPLAEALEKCLQIKSSKKTVILVFTDGEPDDSQAVTNILKREANSLISEDALKFIFIQVGYDSSATKFLQKLDDNLNTKYDIVDAKTMSEAENFPTTVDLICNSLKD